MTLSQQEEEEEAHQSPPSSYLNWFVGAEETDNHEEVIVARKDPGYLSWITGEEAEENPVTPRSPRKDSSYLSWIIGEEDPEVKAIKAKQERYVRQMLALKRIIDQWHSKKVSKHEAVMHADDVMENICAIGVIDGDACRHQLSKHGINDEERLDLQASYESLKRDCGHRVPHYGAVTTPCFPLCC